MAAVLTEKQSSLESVASAALEWARERAPACQAEIFLVRSRSRGVELRDGRLETLQENIEEGMGLRLFSEGRMGFTYSVGLDLAALEEGLSRLLEQLPHIPPDPHRVLPPPGPSGPPAPEGELLDESLFERPIEAELGRLKKLEAAVLRCDPLVKRVISAGYGESLEEICVVNSLGVRACERGSHCSASVSAAAEGQGELQISYGSESGRFYRELDFERLARETAFRASSLIGSRKLPTGRRSVLFDPWVAGEMLELIAGLLSADEVQRGKSLLKGRLGQRIASPQVTLIDDPLKPGGVASSRFDAEGVPTRRKTMIDGGVLREYFYDTYTAHKDGVSSNGSAGRASFKGLPGPGSSNFLLVPGAMKREALLADTRDGILVLDIMGMHTADPVSGEFSVGVSGIAVQDGVLAGGVRGAMLSGNVLELLGRVDAVADDLRFHGSVGSPTFRVADLTVA